MGGGYRCDGLWVRWRIDSNHCYENFYAGIGHASGASATVTNNEVMTTFEQELALAKVRTPLVLGNRCFKNQRAGIGENWSDTIPVIEDNDCFDNQMAGIGVEGSCRHRSRQPMLP